MPAEKRVIQFIKKLPGDSLIVSPQLNENLVEIYGDKTFIEIPKVKFNDTSSAKIDMLREVEKYPETYKKTLIANYTVNEATFLTLINGSRTSTHLKNQAKINDSDKLPTIKELKPEEYDYLTSQINHANKMVDNPVYFLFSFAKFKGILAQREWFVADNDPQNLELLKSLSGDDVVFKDDNAIVVKIR